MTVDRQIDLASAYYVVWERGKRILLITVAVMLVSFVATLFMTKRYEAVAELEVKPSRVGEQVMKGWITPFEVWGLYIDDKTLLGLIGELHLNEEPFNIRKIRDLRSRITVPRYKETNVILIRVEMETPEMAANLANILASHVIEKNLDILAAEAKATADLLDRTLTTRISDNASREKAYLAAEKEYALEIQQKHLDNLISQWQKLMSERGNLRVSTVELASRVASLEKAVSSQPEKFKLDRTLSEDLALLEAIRKVNPDLKGSDLSNLSITVESPNEQHYLLLSEKDRLQAQLDGDQAKLKQIESMIGPLKENIDSIQNKIYDAQMEVAHLKAEYDRSYEIFGGIDKEYGWTPVTVFSERYVIETISEAVPKDKVVSPKRAAIVGLSGSFAFLLAFAYFLLKDLYGITQKRNTAMGS